MPCAQYAVDASVSQEGWRLVAQSLSMHSREWKSVWKRLAFHAAQNIGGKLTRKSMGTMAE